MTFHLQSWMFDANMALPSLHGGLFKNYVYRWRLKLGPLSTFHVKENVRQTLKVRREELNIWFSCLNFKKLFQSWMLAGEGGLRDCLWIISSNSGFSLDPFSLKQGLDRDPIPVNLSLFKSRKHMLLYKLKFFNCLQNLSDLCGIF